MITYRSCQIPDTHNPAPVDAHPVSARSASVSSLSAGETAGVVAQHGDPRIFRLGILRNDTPERAWFIPASEFAPGHPVGEGD